MVQLLVPPANPQVTRETERIAGLRAGHLKADGLPNSLGVLEWIKVFDPLVKENVSNGVRTVSLEDQPGAAPLTGDLADAVRTSCAVFNSLPEDARRVQVPDTSIRKAYDIKADATCVAHANFSSYWWGCTLYCDHCLCNDIELALASGGGAAAIAGAIGGATGAGAIPGAILGAISAFLALYSSTLQWADTKCSNLGADISTTWLAPTPWVKPLC